MRSLHILDIEGGLLANQCQGILCLMVLGHIGRRNQDNRFAQQAELADGTGSGATDDQVGSLVGGTHIGDEVGDLQVRNVLSLQALSNFSTIVLACLPDELDVAGLDEVQMLQHTLVDGAGTQAATNQQNGLLGRVETEGAHGIVVLQRGLQQLLAHGVTRQHNLIGREETLHALVSHTDFRRLLGQQLIGDTGIRVLFLQQTGDAFGGSHIERRATGIASYADGYLWTELLDNLLGHALALPYLVEYLDILQQVLAVEALYGQTFYLVAGGWHTLHLHASQGTHEQNFRIWA